MTVKQKHEIEALLAAAQCGLWHSGAKTLTYLRDGCAQCDGCGETYTLDQVRAAKYSSGALKKIVSQ